MIDRIKQIMQYYNLSTNAFATKIGSSQATLNQQINGTRRLSLETVNKIISSFELISPNWLLTGKGEMLNDPSLKGVTTILHNPKSTEKIEESENITLYDLEAAANLKTLFADKSQNILGQISIPNIPKCDGAVYVKGDSMYPLLKSGDIIAYKEIPLEIQHIFFGEMYLLSIDVDGDEYLTVKYVQHSEKGEDWIKLVSYNQHHEPKDFPLKSVRAMALVKLSIRMNTMK